MAKKLYRFLFADTHQIAQVVANSLRHDLRLVRYMKAAPGGDHRAFGDLEGRLSALLEAFEGEVLGATTRLSAADGPELTVDEFGKHRCALDLKLGTALETSGVLHQQLRAAIDASAPDMTVPWTRLETTDGYAAGVIHQLADSAAREMARVCTANTSGPSFVAEAVFIDFGHHHQIRNLPSEVRDGTIRVSQHLSIPFYLIHMLRLAPLVVHEVCHPFVAHLLNDPAREMCTEAIDLSIELWRGEGAEIPSGSEALFRDFVKRLLLEVVCDCFALHLAGPAYYLAAADLLIGTTGHSALEVGHLVMPLTVRMRTMRELLEAPSESSELVRLLDEEHETFTLSRDDSERTTAWANWCSGMVALTVPFARELLALCPDDPPPRNGEDDRAESRAFDGVQRIWDAADEIVRRDEGSLIDSLEGEAEGICGFRRRFEERSEPVRVELGLAWDLNHVFLNYGARPGLEEGESATADNLLGQGGRTFGINGRSGLVGIVLGACDLLAIRPHLRVRQPDDIEIAFECPAYAKRRILVEIERIERGGDVVFVAPEPSEPIAPTAISHVRLTHEGRVHEFLDQLLRTYPRGDANSPVRIWCGTGWNHLELLWRVPDGRGFRRLHEDVIAQPGGRLVERTVTYLLPQVCRFDGEGTSTVDTGWALGGEWDDVGLITSLRTRDAEELADLRAWLPKVTGWSAGLHPSWIFGLHDAVVTQPIRSGRELLDAANGLWCGVASGKIVRSVCHLEIPTRPS